MIELTSVNGKHVIRVTPEAIECIFEGTGSQSGDHFPDGVELIVHKATIIMASGKEIRVQETPKEIIKLKNDDTISKN